ncbi:MAG: DUF58 domain-containing protein [Planctomycetes bacterium]|nr:DUF58 domain-containing protein [Planctomycetota bacterium]
MIVPSNKCVLYAVLLLPAALLAGHSATAGLMALVLYGMLCLLAAGDAWYSLSRGEAISVQGPELVRLPVNASGRIELTVSHPAGSKDQIEVTLGLPESIETDQAWREVRLSGEGEASRIDWPITPRRRGGYPVTECHLNRPSRLGLWRVRQVQRLTTEIRVTPDLSQDRRILANWFLHRGRGGIHVRKQVGKGREFEKLRDYIPGDCFEDIHWKATAKRGVPITKEFQIERTQEIYLAIDASRLSGQTLRRAEADTPYAPNSLERYITAATLFGLVAERQGDLFGLMAFSDRVETFVRARGGRAHLQSCQQALLDLSPRQVMPDYGEVFSFIRARLRRRALVIFLTDLRDPAQADEFKGGVRLIAHHHLVLATMLEPEGARPLFSGDPPEDLGDIYADLGGHLQWQALQKLQRTLKRARVSFQLIPQERLMVRLIDDYLSVKRRQVL